MLDTLWWWICRQAQMGMPAMAAWPMRMGTATQHTSFQQASSPSPCPARPIGLSTSSLCKETGCPPLYRPSRLQASRAASWTRYIRQTDCHMHASSRVGNAPEWAGLHNLLASKRWPVSQLVRRGWPCSLP